MLWYWKHKGITFLPHFYLQKFYFDILINLKSSNKKHVVILNVIFTKICLIDLLIVSISFQNPY